MTFLICMTVHIMIEELNIILYTCTVEIPAGIGMEIVLVSCTFPFPRHFLHGVVMMWPCPPQRRQVDRMWKNPVLTVSCKKLILHCKIILVTAKLGVVNQWSLNTMYLQNVCQISAVTCISQSLFSCKALCKSLFFSRLTKSQSTNLFAFLISLNVIFTF